MSAAVAALVTVAITLIGSVIMLLMVNYLPESPIQAYISQANSFWVFANGLGFFSSYRQNDSCFQQLGDSYVYDCNI